MRIKRNARAGARKKREKKINKIVRGVWIYIVRFFAFRHLYVCVYFCGWVSFFFYSLEWNAEEGK